MGKGAIGGISNIGGEKRKLGEGVKKKRVYRKGHIVYWLGELDKKKAREN